VAGGDTTAGNWPAIAGFCGPGSVTLAGFVALMALGAACPGCRTLAPAPSKEPTLRRARRRRLQRPPAGCAVLHQP
jgi:hypothetical protein